MSRASVMRALRRRDGERAGVEQAKSHHQHLDSLGRYVRLGEETFARTTAEHDPAARRHQH